MIVRLASLVLGLGSFATPGFSQDIPDDTEIVTTDSGLRYSVLKAGKGGDSPGLTDEVKVHYTGWLAEGGKSFDSSRDSGEPANFKVGGVIEGWNEALQKMTRGAHWKVHIPAALGYGEGGSPGSIPPNADLIFEVELLDFEKGPGMPVHQKVDASKVETIGTACKIQILAEGSGDPAKADQKCIFQYAVFSEGGECQETSLFMPRAIKLEPSRLPMPFLQQALTMLKPGAEAIIEVPTAEQGQNAVDAVVTWYLQILTPSMPALSEVPWKGLDNGLEFHILRPGVVRERAKMGDTITVHYSGWLTNGVMFDSSVGSSASTFKLREGGLIKGWLEGIPLVEVGGSILLRIPADLAYGSGGRPPAIPGGATLIFEIDLLGKDS